MSSIAPKPEPKKTAETPTEQSDIRIFVALCRCGINIAGIIDMETLRQYALTLPNVVGSEIYLAYCTEPGAIYIKEQMEKVHANRLVMGA